VDRALFQGCEAVSKTSETANVILREVTAATETMTASASTAMDSFVAFMDGKGQAVQDELSQHFVVLDNHFLNQKAGVAVVARTTEAYGTDVSGSVVGTTGSTPKKTVYQALDELVKTRDHEAIKQDSRAGIMPLPAPEEDDGEVPEGLAPVTLESISVNLSDSQSADKLAGVAAKDLGEALSAIASSEVGTLEMKESDPASSNKENLSAPEGGEAAAEGEKEAAEEAAEIEVRSRSSTISSTRTGKSSIDLSLAADTPATTGIRENAHPNNSKLSSKGGASTSTSSKISKLSRPKTSS
jgi:hypothetical protein